MDPVMTLNEAHQSNKIENKKIYKAKERVAVSQHPLSLSSSVFECVAQSGLVP